MAALTCAGRQDDATNMASLIDAADANQSSGNSGNALNDSVGNDAGGLSGSVEQRPICKVNKPFRSSSANISQATEITLDYDGETRDRS